MSRRNLLILFAVATFISWAFLRLLSEVPPTTAGRVPGVVAAAVAFVVSLASFLVTGIMLFVRSRSRRKRAETQSS